MHLSPIIPSRPTAAAVTQSTDDLDRELFLEHMDEARSSADEAYSIAEELGAGGPVKWQGGAQGMLQSVADMLGNAISTAEQSTAYLDANHEAVAHARGAIDALNGAAQLIERGPAPGATPALRAAAALELIDAGRSALWSSWVAVDGPED